MISVLKSPEEGAQTIIHCCVDPGAGEETGLYYAECKPKTPSKLARDDSEARKLWTVSEDIVGDISAVVVDEDD